MFFLMFVSIGLPDMLTVVVPHNLIGIFLTIGHDNSSKYISSFGKRYLIKNVMHIGISLTNAIQFPAIQENAGCPKIGIDSDRSFPAFTFRITALRQIKHRLLTPVCLVPIKSILAYFTIKSYQPFHVPRIYTSTLPLRNCKVKHIP